jgi:hypothetical protein
VSGILLAIVLPIFALVGVGVALDRLVRPDLATLNQLNFSVFVPALLLARLTETRLEAGQLGLVAGFVLVHMAAMGGVAALASWRGPLRDLRTSVSLAAMFSNVGNYGIPLVELAYGSGHGGTIAVILLVHNLISFTFGVWLLERGTRSFSATLVNLVKVPVLWVIVIAGLLNLTGVELPQAVRVPVDQLANGLIPVALLTLGVQLSRSRLTGRLLPLILVMAVRLLVAPALAAALVLVWWGLDGTTAAILVATSGLPVAVNVFILCAEYRRDEEFASQLVFWSTLLSAATVSGLLLLLATP